VLFIGTPFSNLYTAVDTPVCLVFIFKVIEPGPLQDSFSVRHKGGVSRHRGPPRACYRIPYCEPQ
jgi:hypothetical protein